MTEALLVMLNNFFHDLAVAFLFASSLVAHLVLRTLPGKPPERLATALSRIAWGSLIWVLVGGAVRTWFFMQYEYLPQAGAGLVPMLIAKHVVLIGVTVLGLVAVVRLRLRLKRPDDAL